MAQLLFGRGDRFFGSGRLRPAKFLLPATEAIAGTAAHSWQRARAEEAHARAISLTEGAVDGDDYGRPEASYGEDGLCGDDGQ